jgi:hypothetical protein
MTGMRPGTGMRQPPGSRQGTARAGPVNMSGVGLNTNMNISDRPVTQQGLSGMRTAGMGPTRQIQDNSYYLMLLRQKCTEIMKEIETLKGGVDQGQKDNAAYGQLERKYETLTNDMRTLQGQLADYNLLLDRSRAHREVRTRRTAWPGVRRRRRVRCWRCTRRACAVDHVRTRVFPRSHGDGCHVCTRSWARHVMAGGRGAVGGAPPGDAEPGRQGACGRALPAPLCAREPSARRRVAVVAAGAQPEACWKQT